MKKDKEVQELLDPATVENFLRHGKAKPQAAAETEASPAIQLVPKPLEERPTALPARKAKNAAVMAPGLIPVNVRVRPEIATALQTASLERQLQGMEPSSKREIVEEALEPWLRANGYLS